MGLGGGQDENNVRWWLLQGLEQGIRGGIAQHMDFVYYVNLEARYAWRVVHLLTKAPDIVHARIACRVNLDDVQGTAFADRLAHGTSIARLTFPVGETVDRLGEDTRRAGLAGTTRAAKKVGMRYAAAFECVQEGLCYRLLSNDLGKGLRTPLAIEDLRRHFHAFIIPQILRST